MEQLDYRRPALSRAEAVFLPALVRDEKGLRMVETIPVAAPQTVGQGRSTPVNRSGSMAGRSVLTQVGLGQKKYARSGRKK